MRARSAIVLGGAAVLIAAGVFGATAFRHAPSRGVVAPSSASAPPVSVPAESSDARVDRGRADEVRRLLHALFADAGAPREDDAGVEAFAEMPDGVPGENTHAPLGSYIRQRIARDFLPLAESCYKNLLAKSPGAGGKATVSFRIVGDRTIGGVVDSAKLAEGSSLADPELALCLRESMMSLSFDAPPGARSEVAVDYTFDFTPD